MELFLVGFLKFIFEQDTQWLLGNLLGILNKVSTYVLEWKPYGHALTKFLGLGLYTGTYLLSIWNTGET